jgi:hypothetical protein
MKPVLSQDADKLARVCVAIISLDPSVNDPDSITQRALEIIEKCRVMKDWRGLQSILKDHLEWVTGLSPATRKKVEALLVSEGL